MSGWQAYADKIVADSHGECNACGIFGNDGSTWAVSTACMSAEEIAGMTKKFTSPTDGQGFHGNGKKFMAIGCTDSLLRGKKGAGWCIASKFKSGFVVAFSDEAASVNSMTDAVEEMSKYLTTSGY